MVLAPGPEEKFRTRPLLVPGWPWGGPVEQSPSLGPLASGWTEVAPGRAFATGSGHVLRGLWGLSTQSPRESLTKSHHPLPATWPFGSGFL